MATFTANQTHAGQYKRYGDTFNEWDVLTDAGEAEAVEWFFSNITGKSIPEEKEFNKNTHSGGEKSGDYAYYFAGYYYVRPIPGGWHFTRVYPYCD